MLDAIETLTGILQRVSVVISQQIVFGQVPEFEHIVRDFSPQHQRLRNIRVLPAMIMR
jgi:hypothetical protein